ITVTGGKLTTFRAIALDTLKHAVKHNPGLHLNWDEQAILAPQSGGRALARLDATEQTRLLGRYGDRAEAFVQQARATECMAIPGTRIWWAELRWIAQHESVHHLDDLLLRRTRLGLVRPQGAQALLPRIQPLIQSELAWDDARWQAECQRYQDIIARCYSAPAALKDAQP
ncbi:MAG: FAD-dependent oxidoreductase, partial [Aquabacterium sp.]|nr:FAD-dependent oxidoreductase [Aquabacterium sp.]